MLQDSWILLQQELILSVLIFILLFIKLGTEKSNRFVFNLVNIGLLLNLIIGFTCTHEGQLFNGLFQVNAWITLEKNILNIAILLISMQSYAWLSQQKNTIELYILLLTSLLGMNLMISSGNFLLLYLGLEMSTIPLAAAANFDLTKRKSSESALKLILSSAFSSGILLMGISFIYGISGSLSFSIIPAHIGNQPMHILALVLFIAGFAFKMSAVPFHLWTADVYEGAPVSITAFLSVVSKAAVLFTLVALFYKVFPSMASTWSGILTLLAYLTILIGNLFAVRQENIKRFLAFSSITQVGFILIAILGASKEGSASLVYFLIVYTFSNLAAFGVVNIISANTNKENISDYDGLYKSNPFLSWVITISLFSLAGVPPTAGFFGKLFLLTAGASKGDYILLTFAALNMVISFFYYLKIVRAIFMKSNENGIPAIQIEITGKLALYISLAGIILTGIGSFIYNYIHSLSFGI